MISNYYDESQELDFDAYCETSNTPFYMWRESTNGNVIANIQV